MPRPCFAFTAVWSAYVLLLGALSLMPGGDVPSFDLSDKLAHSVAYALMAGLAPWSQAESKGAWIAFFAAVLYGAALELGQGALAEERHPDVWDGLANAAGAAAGAIFRRHVDKRRMNEQFRRQVMQGKD